MTAVEAVETGMRLLRMPRRYSFRIRSHGTGLCLLERTPGVACFNPFEWPVLDSMPMAFLGYGEDEGLLAIDAVRSAINETFAEVGWSEP